ncbi:lanthionine synthetase LanC family protein [Spirosoma koreense]
METFLETDVTTAVHRIARSLALPTSRLTSFGYANGLLGQVLFWLYYADFADDEAAGERAQALLMDAIERVTQPYKGHNYAKELAEFGIFLEYARANNLIEFDTNLLLNGPDALLADTLITAFERRDFDPFTGALAPSFYFLRRLATNRAVRSHLARTVMELNSSAKLDPDGNLFWPSKLFGDDRVYLGLSHGSAAIILFLTCVIEAGILVSTATDVLRRSIGYLLTHRQDYRIVGACYPDIVGEQPQRSRLGLCYGDMGVAYSLLRAARVLNDSEIYGEALTIFSIAASRRTPDRSGIQDAGILYGAAGTALLFDKAYELTGQLVFDEAARYWYERIPGFAVHDNPTAGYRGVFNQHFPHTNIAFMEGIAGIGAALMKYTQRDNYSFDELIWLL